MTRERARQIQNIALAKMRRILEKQDGERPPVLDPGLVRLDAVQPATGRRAARQSSLR